MRFTNFLLAFLFTVYGASAATLPVAMSTTNGQAKGTTTIGGRFDSTNTVAGGGTNQISGALHLGRERLLPTTDDRRLTIYDNLTNPAASYVGSTYSASRFNYTTNTDKLNAGLSVIAGQGAANTGNFTQDGYPGIMGINVTVQPATGSSGFVRKQVGVSSTVAGNTGGAGVDEAAAFGGDTASGNMNYVVGLKLTGMVTGGTNNTGIWLGQSQNTRPQNGNWAIWDETGSVSQLSSNLAVLGKAAIGSTGSTNWLSVAGGSLTTGSKAASVTGSLAASAAREVGVDITITGSGSGANENDALNVTLASGYTGSGYTVAENISNASLGTGASGWNGGVANYGLYSLGSGGVTAGHRVGVLGQGAGSSTLNMGGIFRAVSASGSPLINVGLAGFALNASVDEAAGYFALMSTTPNLTNTAALIANNGAVAAPIFLAQDNSGVVFGIADGGVIHGDAAGVSNAVTLIATSDCLIITTNADGRTFGLGLASSGADVLTNSRAAATLEGLTLTGITTNGATGGSNWVGGISLWNPATGKTIIITNGNAIAQGTIVSTNTATANTALTLNGAASGAAGVTAEYQTNGVSKWKFDNAGLLTTAAGATIGGAISANGNIQASTSGYLGWNNNARAYSPATDRIRFANNGNTAGAQIEALSAVLTNGVIWESGSQLTNIYTATATLDFGNVATIGCADLTMTVTGAALGDVVDLGVPNASVVANSSYSAWVSAVDTVTVRFCALISGDPASGVFRAEVHKWK